MTRYQKPQCEFYNRLDALGAQHKVQRAMGIHEGYVLKREELKAIRLLKERGLIPESFDSENEVLLAVAKKPKP